MTVDAPALLWAAASSTPAIVIVPLDIKTSGRGPVTIVVVPEGKLIEVPTMKHESGCPVHPLKTDSLQSALPDVVSIVEPSVTAVAGFCTQTE